MKFLTLVFLSSTMISSSLFAQELGSIEAGKRKSATCIGCHGEAGVSSNNLWPNLAKQKKDYLVKQLQEFHLGKRVDPLMSPISKTLTEQDIKDLAAYYSSL